jgi:hypothetical protein
MLRFPADFMFQLSREEFDSLRSQIVTSNSVNIEIMRAFVRLFLIPENDLNGPRTRSGGWNDWNNWNGPRCYVSAAIE